MYGSNETTTAAGTMLAVTGMTSASWLLAALGVVFLAAGIWALVRKPGENRP